MSIVYSLIFPERPSFSEQLFKFLDHGSMKVGHYFVGLVPRLKVRAQERDPKGSDQEPTHGHLQRRYLARRLEILPLPEESFACAGSRRQGCAISPRLRRFHLQSLQLFPRKVRSPFLLPGQFSGPHDRRARQSAANEDQFSAKLRLVISSHLRCVLDEVEDSRRIC